jgi:hypothetical protein
METSVEALKSSMSAASHGSGDPSHGLEESVQANQGHRSRIALPNFSMSNR